MMRESGIARRPGRRSAATLVVAAALVVTSVPVAAVATFRSAGPHPAPAAGAPPEFAPGVLVAAGDVACDPRSSMFAHGHGTATWCRAADTASLIRSIDPDVVLPLGDEQYDDGRITKFRRSYDASWGTFLDRTRPVPGNHEYGVHGAAGYFRYFGAEAGPTGRGWYSYDLAGWHLVALNSNCDQVGCLAGSPQYRWLAADLRAHPAACTLAYFHHPRFSSGPHGNDPEAAWTRDLWRLLYARGADVILNGHDHLYERFAPMNPAGTVDRATGIREFVVGTGGAEHYWVDQVRWASQVRNADTFGVLQLTLRTDAYGWRFVPVAGGSFEDSGFGRCHGAPGAAA